MEALIHLAVLLFATWRAAYFISSEKGPFGIATLLRRLLGTCFACASVWTAAAAAGVGVVAGWLEPWEFFLYTPGLSAMAMWLSLLIPEDPLELLNSILGDKVQ